MRRIHPLSILILISLGAPCAIQGQGGGRNQAGRGAAAQQRTGRGGRGAGAPATPEPASGAVEFYNYDSTAAGGAAIGDPQPAETHQKITANGQPLAYTTHAGYLPLRNATTGQAEAHLFY